MNLQIRVPQVRVLDEDGNQLGVLPTHEALRQAQERGLDLVEVAPTSAPPVCKYLNYGQYKYELQKKEKDSKKRQKTVDLKELRCTPKIGEADLLTKIRQALDAVVHAIVIRKPPTGWVSSETARKLPEWNAY
ncbi:MAG: translation initiation factor IF-3 [bacterium Ellin6529]|nr:translation initiation factor IF-3 [bacterium Ellin6529]